MAILWFENLAFRFCLFLVSNFPHAAMAVLAKLDGGFYHNCMVMHCQETVYSGI